MGGSGKVKFKSNLVHVDLRMEKCVTIRYKECGIFYLKTLLIETFKKYI